MSNTVRPPRLPIDDEDAPLYSVGQVAAMLDVRQAFLRRLDEHQVVRPSRTEGGQRRYSRREVACLQYVISLVGEGMTLVAVRRILDLEERMRELRRRLLEAEARQQPRSRRASIPPLGQVRG